MGFSFGLSLMPKIALPNLPTKRNIDGMVLLKGLNRLINERSIIATKAIIAMPLTFSRMFCGSNWGRPLWSFTCSLEGI